MEDMGAPPSKDHSLDRINPDGDYSPENCRWSNQETQRNNRTNSRIIVINGEALTIAQWARRVGIKQKTIRARIDIMGWNVVDAVMTKPRPVRSLISQA